MKDKKNTMHKTLKPGQVLYIGAVEISVEKSSRITLRVPSEITVCGPGDESRCKKPLPSCPGGLRKKLGWEG